MNTTNNTENTAENTEITEATEYSNSYFYSPATKSFYSESLKSSYIAAGSWPEDAVQVEYSVYQQFTNGTPPAGKMRGTDITGQPAWVDIPPLPLEELKKIKLAAIEQWRVKNETQRFSVDWDGKQWDCDKITVERINIALSQAQNNTLPADFYWTDASNTNVPLTAPQLTELATAINTAMFNSIDAIHGRQREMKNYIEQSTDAVAIAAFIPYWE